jgi:hypothetical protein
MHITPGDIALKMAVTGKAFRKPSNTTELTRRPFDEVEEGPA